MMKSDQFPELVRNAWSTRDHAHAPYSNFKVGAALLAADGSIHSGANLECLSYGLTICAERNALGRAISEGHRKFECIVIVADTHTPIAPCGACRQLLAEFGTELEVISLTRVGEERRRSLSSLLPESRDGILEAEPPRFA